MRASPRVAALAVMAMVSGCATYQQSKGAAIGGGVTTGVSLVLAFVGFSIAGATTNSGGSFSCGSSSACTVASGVGVAGVFGVPIGVAITVGGLLGMAGYSERGEPSPPPQVRDLFWCQRDSGICTNEEASCGPDCLSAKSIWCAPYKTVDGEPGLLCGLSSDVCLVLSISDHNRRGREGFGECAQRTEPLPPATPNSERATVVR